MNALIARVTSPGFRKYVYRISWVALTALVASGKIDQGQMDVIVAVVAAILALADSQTAPSTSVIAVAQAQDLADVSFNQGIRAAEEMASDTLLDNVVVEDTPVEKSEENWIPTEGTWEE